VEVRQGYKLTEVGVIPEEWEIPPLADVSWFQEGPGVRNFQFTSSGIKLLNGTNIARGELDLNTTTRFISAREAYGPYAHFLADEGDIVIASSGITVQRLHEKVAFVRADNLPFCMNTSTIRFKPHVNLLTPDFLFQFLTSEGFKRPIGGQATGSAQLNFGPSHVAKVRIALPPIAEQRKIATALRDADALLGGLDRLIAKKRDVKQAAMQQLLTGQTRLPGFHGKWEVKRLGELGPFLKGSGVKKDEARSGVLPCIRYGEIYTHHHDYIRSFNSWISQEVADTATPLQRGDLLFAGSGETKEEIGKCVAFIDDLEAYAGGDIVILRPTEAHSLFLGYLLNSPAVASQKASRGQGDAVVHISASALASIDLSLPIPDEQAAIAAVLSDMDAELFALDSRRDKTRALKQAMMQELLTGRIRLLTPKANVVSLVKKPETNKSTHNQQIEEAAILGVLAQLFGTEQHPLARVRRSKLLYLLQRHLGQQTETYLKKAAGPYKPGTRYKGPEGIALKNGYVRAHHNGTYEGFVAGEKVIEAKNYVVKWHGAAILEWLEQFRFSKTEELELLATVDMAMQDLKKAGQSIATASVKQVIQNHPEWKAKLERDIFSDNRIASAIGDCGKLFA
jgi:type I restriction enzyme S subunit